MQDMKLRSLQLELTSRCNERCVHCYIPQGSKTVGLDTAFVFDILSQYRDMGGQNLTISGGEPMCHPDCLDIVDRASVCGFSIRIFSNLTLFDGSMVPRLKAANLREIQTSLYSIVPEIHDAVTGLPGSCEKTKTALEKLNESGIPVFISCPVMKQNKDSYGAVIQWGKARNIRSAPDNMIFARFDRSTDNLTSRLDIDEALRVVKDILKNDPGAYRRERFAPGYNNPDEALPCVQGVCKGSLCVNAAGEALPSPGWHRVLGNLHKQTLRDIWETSAELKRVQSISLDDFPKCQTCPDIQFCGMSLEGNANENPQGNPFIIPAQVCELARRTRELVWAWYESKDTP